MRTRFKRVSRFRSLGRAWSWTTPVCRWTSMLWTSCRMADRSAHAANRPTRITARYPTRARRAHGPALTSAANRSWTHVPG